MSNPGLPEIVAAILKADAPAGMTTKIVGIDGCGGAGKSTLAARLGPQLGAQIIHTDDFASWEETPDWAGRLQGQVIAPLIQNKPGRYQRYDWGTKVLAEWHDVPLQPFVIIEGVSALRAAFRHVYAFTIFIDTPAAECLRRGLARDGAAASAQWAHWQREEAAYLAQDRPQTYAKLVLDGTLPVAA